MTLGLECPDFLQRGPNQGPRGQVGVKVAERFWVSSSKLCHRKTSRPEVGHQGSRVEHRTTVPRRSRSKGACLQQPYRKPPGQPHKSAGGSWEGPKTTVLGSAVSRTIHVCPRRFARKDPGLEEKKPEKK